MNKPELSIEENHRIVSHLMMDGTREGLILSDLINSKFGASNRRMNPELFND